MTVLRFGFRYNGECHRLGQESLRPQDTLTPPFPSYYFCFPLRFVPSPNSNLKIVATRVNACRQSIEPGDGDIHIGNRFISVPWVKNYKPVDSWPFGQSCRIFE